MAKVKTKKVKATKDVPAHTLVSFTDGQHRIYTEDPDAIAKIVAARQAVEDCREQADSYQPPSKSDSIGFDIGTLAT